MNNTLEVALVQNSLVWESPSENRINFENMINGLDREVDLYILPEMFTTGFTMSPDNLKKSQGEDTLHWMKEMAKKKNAAIVGSAPFFENKVYTNRLFFVMSDGHFFHYDKRHTFTLAGEHQIYGAGKKRLTLTYRGFKICPLICYDLRFPVWSRNDEAYDVLIYVANWPKPRILAWDTLLKARAIENMAYCIGVNRVGMDESGHEYCGHSAVYDALGTQLAFSNKAEVMVTTLQKQTLLESREKFKFLEDRDAFTLKA